MSDTSQNNDTLGGAAGHSPQVDVSGIRIHRPVLVIDFATILGLTFAIGLILAAIVFGSGNAQFFNMPAVLIVVCGTIAVTSISYTGEELGRAWKVVSRAMFRRLQVPSIMARQLVEMAVLVRKHGPLVLSRIESDVAKDPELSRVMQYLVDGYTAQDIDLIMSQEIGALVERHQRSAGIVRRAAEIAPGMGLIGTLVGLVQMLAQLDDPSAIGPAMAVALLTTFYGAILGTVILTPMAAKLERNSQEEALNRALIHTALVSMGKQESPRRLEHILNSLLPPSEQIKYFD
ncbi:MAG: MotA/TolQ/ExbB proton channel family protein [Alphaproteobacteria bacterium]|nr:biopolymer transporter ExbB [Alphaproteobacteria bacterium]MCS5596397.1 MotA/TolQ/ExbB proton channel family protein [Alphaproteobacteria bacterium]|tara:strand:- start:1330 stop:2199 length:870 start_codon:yes stop_codon:yes gene_type:complete